MGVFDVRQQTQETDEQKPAEVKISFLKTHKKVNLG